MPMRRSMMTVISDCINSGNSRQKRAAGWNVSEPRKEHGIGMDKERKIGGRENGIDALKGIAILGVIMVHSGAASLPGLFGKIGAAGAKGVQLFLIITAYLTWKSVSRVREGKESGRNWLIQRFIRIAPLYYVCIAVYLAALGSGKRYWLGTLERVSVWNVLSHLLFLNGLNPFWTNSILGVEWYLAAIVLFYVFALLFYKKADSFERAAAGLTICSLGYFVLKTLSNRISFGENDYIWRNYMDGFSFFSSLPVLMLGVVLFYICKSETFEAYRGKAVLSYAVGISAVWVLLCLVVGESYLGGKYGLVITTEFLYGIGFSMLFISQRIKSWKLIDNPFFGILGRYSYGMFLIHMLLAEKYDTVVPMRADGGIADWGIKFVLITALSFVLAYAAENGINLLLKKGNGKSGK